MSYTGEMVHISPFYLHMKGLSLREAKNFHERELFASSVNTLVNRTLFMDCSSVRNYISLYEIEGGGALD